MRVVAIVGAMGEVSIGFPPRCSNLDGVRGLSGRGMEMCHFLDADHNVAKVE